MFYRFAEWGGVMMSDARTSSVGSVTTSFLVGLLALDVVDLVILPRLRGIFKREPSKQGGSQVTPTEPVGEPEPEPGPGSTES